MEAKCVQERVFGNFGGFEQINQTESDLCLLFREMIDEKFSVPE